MKQKQQGRGQRTIEVADTIPAPSGVRVSAPEQAPSVPITGYPPEPLGLGGELRFCMHSRELLNGSMLGRYRMVSPEWLARTTGAASRKY